MCNKNTVSLKAQRYQIAVAFSCPCVKKQNLESLVCLPQPCHQAACQPIFSHEFTVFLVELSLHKYFLS